MIKACFKTCVINTYTTIEMLQIFEEINVCGELSIEMNVESCKCLSIPPLGYAIGFIIILSERFF